jgi:dTDP-4-amino-4,6-dideoxygalactose transaminase
MIQYGRHSISPEDIELVSTALRSDWLTTGPFVTRFEQVLENEVGAPAISVSSGTAALHCAFAAIGLKPGDEVITPPITFVATQATAIALGATVVFADVNLDTATINPDKVEEAITSKTKAIVAVDFGGHPAELYELRELAQQHGIYLIEDAAHSIGSTYRNQKVGAIADLTTFSFFPTKNLTTGEGGAISSNDPLLLQRAERFSRQGLIRNRNEFTIPDQGDWHQEVHEFGLNYRLPDILCALGVSQLKRLEEFKKRRSEIFHTYKEAFAALSWLEPPTERSYVNPNWHLFACRVPAEKRKSIYNLLRENGIGVQVNYIPAYHHPAFSNYNINRELFPNSEEFYSREISLPIHYELTDKELDYIIDTLVNLKV